jgi:class 3 adenylate cyclase
MAVLLRSISIKIFGVAVVLLVIMAAAAAWSGRLTEQVHLQLQTLDRGLFPMALAIAEVHSGVASEMTSLPTAGPRCPAQLHGMLDRNETLIRRTIDYRARAAKLAVLERNKLELARLEPMLDDLAYDHGKLIGLVPALCSGDAEAKAEAARRVAEVRRHAGAINHEIARFVATGAVIVGDNQRRAMTANFLLIAAAGAVGLLLAWLVARGLTRPISRLQAGARAIQQGRLDADVPVTSSDEIGDVTRTFNAMLAELREKERIKATFGQYVDPRVVAGLVSGSADRSTVGEKQTATLFFSDIAGFTPLAERLAPSTLVRLINAYFAAMSACIRDRQGIIDKYIGDAIMAFWVPPFAEPSEQARLACLAALDQCEALDRFRGDIPDLIGMRRDLPTIDMRIGIATGEVVVGSIGSEHARSFTAMGDTVNFGARLEGVNTVYGTRILIDAMTRAMAGDAIDTREIDTVRVVGREEPVVIHELTGRSGAIDPKLSATMVRYTEGLALYRAGKWTEARPLFAEAAIEDGPSRTLLARIDALSGQPPEDWSGVWTLASK